MGVWRYELAKSNMHLLIGLCPATNKNAFLITDHFTCIYANHSWTLKQSLWRWTDKQAVILLSLATHKEIFHRNEKILVLGPKYTLSGGFLKIWKQIQSHAQISFSFKNTSKGRQVLAPQCSLCKGKLASERLRRQNDEGNPVILLIKHLADKKLQD